MRIAMILALITGGLALASPASALSPVLGIASPVAVETVASKKVYKQRKARRYARRNDWTERRYWRPYQYRYWKYYYPYGGPLF